MINPEELKAALDIAERTQWNFDDPAFDEHLAKYGRQPHHTLEEFGRQYLSILKPCVDVDDTTLFELSLNIAEAVFTLIKPEATKKSTQLWGDDGLL